MIWRRTPSHGSELIGEIRCFTVRSTDWRAFEFTVPESPHREYLMLVSRSTHFAVHPVPPDWRTADPDDLLERFGILPREIQEPWQRRD